MTKVHFNGVEIGFDKLKQSKQDIANAMPLSSEIPGCSKWLIKAVSGVTITSYFFLCDTEACSSESQENHVYSLGQDIPFSLQIAKYSVVEFSNLLLMQSYVVPKKQFFKIFLKF